MKKVICVVGIVLFFASMVFAAAITKKDLGSLKGTWEGFASAGTSNANLKIEIMNDAEPVEGKVTLSNIPAGDWKTNYGIPDPWTAHSKEGKITSKGTVMFLGDMGNFFEITSVGKDKSGKAMVQGWFYSKGVRADFSATKK